MQLSDFAKIRAVEVLPTPRGPTKRYACARRFCATAFFNVRETPGLRKKPSTSELLDWIKLLLAEDIPPEALRGDDPKKLIPVLHGALLKNEQDVHLFEQLVFLNRRAGR